MKKEKQILSTKGASDAGWKKIMEMRVGKIEREVGGIKKNMATKTDLKRLEKTLIPLRDKASRYDMLVSFVKSKWFIPVCIIALCVVGLAGQRIVEIAFRAFGMGA